MKTMAITEFKMHALRVLGEVAVPGTPSEKRELRKKIRVRVQNLSRKITKIGLCKLKNCYRPVDRGWLMGDPTFVCSGLNWFPVTRGLSVYGFLDNRVRWLPKILCVHIQSA